MACVSYSQRVQSASHPHIPSRFLGIRLHKPVTLRLGVGCGGWQFWGCGGKSRAGKDGTGVVEWRRLGAGFVGGDL
ncbi:MAG: hypothetical protein PHC41_09725 [Lachnospiraceae bacterium]|nr:hypothetical protein [Lachnospiraceae bacterium]